MSPKLQIKFDQTGKSRKYAEILSFYHPWSIPCGGIDFIILPTIYPPQKSFHDDTYIAYYGNIQSIGYRWEFQNVISLPDPSHKPESLFFVQKNWRSETIHIGQSYVFCLGAMRNSKGICKKTSFNNKKIPNRIPFTEFHHKIAFIFQQCRQAFQVLKVSSNSRGRVFGTFHPRKLTCPWKGDMSGFAGEDAVAFLESLIMKGSYITFKSSFGKSPLTPKLPATSSNQNRANMGKIITTF